MPTRVISSSPLPVDRAARDWIRKMQRLRPSTLRYGFWTVKLPMGAGGCRSLDCDASLRASGRRLPVGVVP